MYDLNARILDLQVKLLDPKNKKLVDDGYKNFDAKNLEHALNEWMTKVEKEINSIENRVES